MVFILVIVLLIVGFFLWYKIRKIPKLGSMTLVSGGIKTGKSTLSVYLALRKIKRNRLIWKIKCVFFRIFKFLRFKKFKNREC